MASKNIPFSKSIFLQLLLAFVLVFLIPALINSAVSAWSSYQIGRQRTFDQLDSVATLKTAEIDLWAGEMEMGLNMLVNQEDLNSVILPLLQGGLSPEEARQAKDRLQRDLSLMLGDKNLFDRICLLDAAGKVIVSTDPDYEDRDLSGADFYQQGLQEEFVSPPSHSSEDRQWIIVVSHPIIAPGKGAAGVLAGYSDISVLERILEEPAGLGARGENYLVGADYVPITPLHFPTDPSSSPIGSNGIHAAIANKVRGHSSYRNYVGDPVLGVYTWLPTLQAALVVEQGESDAFGPFKALMGTSLAVGLAATILTVLVAFFATRRIAVPIQALSSTAARIAAGDLNQVADVQRQDEIGNLARAFNRMTAQLRALIEKQQAELTERERAEEALRESEEHYRTLFEHLPIPAYTKDRSGVYTSCNAENQKYWAKSLVGRTDAELFSAEEADALRVADRYVMDTGESLTVEESFTNTLLGECQFLSRKVPLRDGRGNVVGIVGVSLDITERKVAEEALRQAESKYRDLVERLPQVIYTAEAGIHGTWLYVSPQIEKMLGFTPQEWMDNPDLWYLQIHPDDRDKHLAIELQAAAEDRPFEGEYRIYTKQGREIWLRDSGVFLPAKPGKVRLIQGTLMDVTDRKRVEAALRQSDERYRLLFENAPVGILMVEPNGQILEVNSTALRILGSPSAQATKEINLLTFLPLIEAGIAAGFKQCAETGQPLEGEYPYKTKWGKAVEALLRFIPIPNEDGTVSLIQLLVDDISEREHAEKLQASTYEIAHAAMTADSLDELFVQIHEILQRLLPTQYFYIALYDREADILSFPYFQDAYDVPTPPGKPGRGLTEYVLRTGKPLLATPARLEELVQGGEVELIGADSIEWLGVPLIAQEQPMGVMVVQSYDEAVHFDERDVEVMVYVSTQVAGAIERKRAEAALRESEARLHSIFDNATVGIYRATPSGRLLFSNPAGVRMLGYDSFEELAARNLADGYAPGHPRSQFIERMEREGRVIGLESAWKKKDGSVIYVRESATLVRDETGQALYFDGTFEDITDRKTAEERSQRQFDHLAALSMIDRVITSSFDLRNNLDAILTYTLRQLGVDAASILLLDPDSLTLSYTAWRGFRTKLVERAQVRLGRSRAGQAVMQHAAVHADGPEECPDDPFLQSLLQREGFVAYCGVPLLVKGRSLGVLEVFRRASFEPDQEWLEFLNTLAGQTAIAIDNSQLFEGLQRSNLNLTLAYDATIEGWSRALDLRDQETEGHTQRVADLTLKLARLLNIPEADLTHIRRGALLHDIGKLGIPDRILLKAGALTKKETEIMRRHPVYAYDMLMPIAYLRPAMDIPYCHHEKWDGTGYPRGLKGENIPLAARLFAIVDVWDALRTTRRYREAWSAEKALQYIRGQSGKYFDPRVVETFLNLIADQP